MVSVALVLVGFIPLRLQTYKLLSVATRASFVKDRVICQLLRLHTCLLGGLGTFPGLDKLTDLSDPEPRMVKQVSESIDHMLSWGQEGPPEKTKVAQLIRLTWWKVVCLEPLNLTSSGIKARSPETFLFSSSFKNPSSSYCPVQTNMSSSYRSWNFSVSHSKEKWIPE